jgi:hypothetical protein
VPTSIAEILVADLKDAMKSGDNERRDVIRMLRSALKYQEIELRRALEDDDTIAVIQAQIKQRRDSIEAFDGAGRTDLANRERAELDILLSFLPDELRPLDQAELERIVAAKVEELDLHSPGDMRVLMPVLIAATSGRADNRLLSTLAAAELRQRASAGAP